MTDLTTCVFTRQIQLQEIKAKTKKLTIQKVLSGICGSEEHGNGPKFHRLR
jgi:hypothetical protein